MCGPAARRALERDWGSVAPTTRPRRGGSDADGVVDSARVDHSLESVAIFS
jgi:hypothetical protein